METTEKSKKYKKRIARGCIAVGSIIILLTLFWFVNQFIIGAAKASEKVNAYETAQYMHPKHIEMSYDWYLGGGYIGEGYRYEPESDLIVDKERNQLWYKYFERKMETLKESFHTNVLLTDYSLMTYYDGCDAQIRYDDFFLYGVYNTQPVKEEERIEVATEIIWKIIESLRLDYNVCGAHIDYYDLSGVYRFSINMEKETLTKEMLLASVEEISFADNLLIEEKWKEFTALRKPFWSIPVEGYEIAMMGMEEYGDYQLVKKSSENETFLKTYRRMETNPKDYLHGSFTDILGHDGFYVYEGDFFIYGDYYTIENETLQQIAQAFGFLITPENSYVQDINGDGVNEKKVISKTISSYYRPEENAVFISYLYEDSDDWIGGLYPIELEKIYFYPYR